MAKVLGIDLGTTNSAMAVLEGGKPVIVPNAEGGRTTPSVVGFTKGDERLVGQVAKRQAVSNPERTISSIKRKMGTNYTITIDEKTYTPPEISAMILQKMKADAESHLGEKITKAVITVPAYFNDNQRQATKDAGTIAGLEVMRIINEPTASSLAYGLEKEEGEKIAVYDLGGGTFDISILEVGDGTFQVLSTDGDTQLGGDDWDKRVIDWMVEEYRKDQGIDLNKDRTAMQRLSEAAEKAKIELSGLPTTNINLPYITADASGPKHLDMTLTRAKFEELTKDLLERTIDPMNRALRDAKPVKVEAKNIDRVILVGGSTRMPAVIDLINDFFGKEPYKNINPDECVALGAAIQAGVITGEVKDIVLLDVTPLSLGVETLGSVFTRLIDRNTTIPTKKSQIFSTAADNQTSVEVHVLQGERPMAIDNITLGRFHLIGIPPAPRGIPQIEVTFDIDANGIVNVSAKDLGTGKQQQITITGSSNLNEEEIKQKVRDAEKYTEEDKKKKDAIETRNQAETMVYTAERTLKEFGDKVSTQDKESVEKAIEKLKESLKGDDIAQIKKDMETLSEEIQKVGAAVYQQVAAQQQAQQAQQAQASQEPQEEPKTEGDKDYVDADYKIVDEDEKQ